MNYWLKFLSIMVVFGVVLTGCQKTKSPKASGMDLTKRVKSEGLKELTVSVGTVMNVDMSVHGSVGTQADYKIGDRRIVGLLRKDLTYLRPERMKPGMTGGDAAKERFYFKAIAPGVTEIQLISEFRGKVEKTYTFTVTVK